MMSLVEDAHAVCCTCGIPASKHYNTSCRKKESKPRDHTVLLKEMCSQASFASEGLLATHTCMLILIQCCILTFFNLVLFPVKTTGMHRFKGLSESLMKLDHTMIAAVAEGWRVLHLSGLGVASRRGDGAKCPPKLPD